MKRRILSYNNGVHSILYLFLFYCYYFVVVAADADVVFGVAAAAIL